MRYEQAAPGWRIRWPDSEKGEHQRRDEEVLMWGMFDVGTPFLLFAVTATGYRVPIDEMVHVYQDLVG